MTTNRAELLDRFNQALADLDPLFPDDRFSDQNVEADLHRWLDGRDAPLAWSDPVAVTPDEWFFVTTLYGEMTAEGQRSHIRTHFPSLFVAKANRDIRDFRPDLFKDVKLRSEWMAARLCKMAAILRERRQTMTDYTADLKQLEKNANPCDPMPALDKLVLDHWATGWKTLSVFVRDCVGGNCFPIDSRVQKELNRFGLPAQEGLLVSLALEAGRNPRVVARMFYQAVERR